MCRKDKRQSHVGSKKKSGDDIKKEMTVKRESKIKNIAIKSVCVCVV